MEPFSSPRSTSRPLCWASGPGDRPEFIRRCVTGDSAGADSEAFCLCLHSLSASLSLSHRHTIVIQSYGQDCKHCDKEKNPRKPLCPLLLVWWCLHYVFAQCVSLLMKLIFSLFFLHPAPCFQKNSKTSWRKISLFHFSVLSIRIGLLTGGSKNTHGSLAFPLSPSGQKVVWRAVCVQYTQAIISVSEGKVVLLDGVGSTIREWWSGGARKSWRLTHTHTHLHILVP